MWAADFNEVMTGNLEKNCLEPLVIQLPADSEVQMREESVVNGSSDLKGDSHRKYRIAESSKSDSTGIKSESGHPFCGLTRNLFSRNGNLQICTAIISARNGDDELPVFCVAAILILNRQKIMRETRSIDDMIKASALPSICSIVIGGCCY